MKEVILKNPHISGGRFLTWMGLLGCLRRVRAEDHNCSGSEALGLVVVQQSSWHLLQHTPCQIDSNWLGYEHMIKGAARFIYQERLKSSICAA